MNVIQVFLPLAVHFWYYFFQTGTEVYLFDFKPDVVTLEISNPLNVSESPGYDNQPSFPSLQNVLLYSATRNGQTDVVHYDFESKEEIFLTETPGSEYSPTQMPSKTSFSTILLETDGTQLLWSYPMKGAEIEPEILFPELKVGYHAWLREGHVFLYILEEDGNRLYYKAGSQMTMISDKPGRSLQLRPGTQNLTYLQNDEEGATVKIYNPEKGTSKTYCKMLDGSAYFAWIDQNRLLAGRNSQLFMREESSDTWRLIADLDQFGITGISRIAISREQGKIAIVATE